MLMAGAAALWFGVHAGIAGTGLRRALVSRLGERGFLVGFSALSVATIVLLVNAYKSAPTTVLWDTPGWLQWIAVGAMLPAFILFVGSVSIRNPTAVGGTVGPGEPRGMLRVTRHPMLWSFAIWGGVHALVNGDTASLLLFGAFLVTALAGMPSIDRKLAARDPAGWQLLSGATSILPFGAIGAGRNRLVLGELVWVVLAGAVAWAAMLALHPVVIGVPALPG